MNQGKPTKSADRLDRFISAASKMVTLGERHKLGGDGEPVGIVIVYRNQAFLNASWDGNADDRMAALVQAAAAEGIKK